MDPLEGKSRVMKMAFNSSAEIKYGRTKDKMLT